MKKPPQCARYNCSHHRRGGFLNTWIMIMVRIRDGYEEYDPKRVLEFSYKLCSLCGSCNSKDTRCSSLLQELAKVIVVSVVLHGRNKMVRRKSPAVKRIRECECQGCEGMNFRRHPSDIGFLTFFLSSCGFQTFFLFFRSTP